MCLTVQIQHCSPGECTCRALHFWMSGCKDLFLLAFYWPSFSGRFLLWRKQLPFWLNCLCHVCHSARLSTHLCHLPIVQASCAPRSPCFLSNWIRDLILRTVGSWNIVLWSNLMVPSANDLSMSYPIQSRFLEKIWAMSAQNQPGVKATPSKFVGCTMVHPAFLDTAQICSSLWPTRSCNHLPFALFAGHELEGPREYFTLDDVDAVAETLCRMSEAGAIFRALRTASQRVQHGVNCRQQSTEMAHHTAYFLHPRHCPKIKDAER